VVDARKIRRICRGCYDLQRSNPIIGQTAPEIMATVQALMDGNGNNGSSRGLPTKPATTNRGKRPPETFPGTAKAVVVGRGRPTSKRSLEKVSGYFPHRIRHLFASPRAGTLSRKRRVRATLSEASTPVTLRTTNRPQFLFMPHRQPRQACRNPQRCCHRRRWYPSQRRTGHLPAGADIVDLRLRPDGFAE